MVQLHERRVGLGRFRKRFQERGHQPRKQLPRASAPGGSDAAMVPAADHSRDRRRLGKTHARKRRDSFRIFLYTGKNQTARTIRKWRLAFEQARVMALDPAQSRSKGFFEGVGVIKPGKARHVVKFVGRFWYQMRLLVFNHLQPVLKHSQETVSIREFFIGVFRDMAARAERMEGAERGWVSQRGIASSENELLRLNEEFDFANSSPPELDIVPGHRNAAVTRMAVDLTFYRMDVLDGSIVEMLAPDERLHALQKRRAGNGIPCALACLDPGCTLPVLAHGLVIGFGQFRGHRDPGRARIGAEAQIDAKYISVSRRFGEQLHDSLDRLHGGHLAVARAREGKAAGFEKSHKINVARIIEFESSHLSHRQHDEAALLLSDGVAIAGFTARLRSDLKAECTPDAAIGKTRQMPHAGIKAQNPGNVAKRDGKRGAPPGNAQPRLCSRKTSLFTGGNGVRIQPFKPGFGALSEQLKGKSRFLQEQARKIGTVTRGGCDNGPERFALCEFGFERVQQLQQSFGTRLVEYCR